MSLAMPALVDSVHPDDCNRRIFELAKTIDRALQGIFKLLPEETKPLQRSADHLGLALGPNVSGRDFQSAPRVEAEESHRAPPSSGRERLPPPDETRSRGADPRRTRAAPLREPEPSASPSSSRSFDAVTDDENMEVEDDLNTSPSSPSSLKSSGPSEST